jgi:putative ubiquitin-RnfH superfamily antitoxin RatB of RatAB toxin-antitoxin module
MAHADAPAVRIEVVFCAGPGLCDRVCLSLPQGSRLQDAVAASGLCQRHGLQVDACPAGIWGRMQAPDACLRDLDRVELYRPLRVDPKEARRLRYKRSRRAAPG